MRYGNFLIKAGIFLMLCGITSIFVYYASIFPNIKDFLKVIFFIFFIVSLILIFFDESIANYLGDVKPESVRGLGFGIPFIFVMVSYLISSAIEWMFLSKLIEFTVLGLIGLAIVITLAVFYFRLRGNDNAR